MKGSQEDGLIKNSINSFVIGSMKLTKFVSLGGFFNLILHAWLHRLAWSHVRYFLQEYIRILGMTTSVFVVYFRGVTSSTLYWIFSIIFDPCNTKAMLLVLNDEHKEHLSFLTGISGDGMFIMWKNVDA